MQKESNPISQKKENNTFKESTKNKKKDGIRVLAQKKKVNIYLFFCMELTRGRLKSCIEANKISELMISICILHDAFMYIYIYIYYS